MGCGSDQWHQFNACSFPRCVACRHRHSQEFNMWVVLSQLTGITVDSLETCQKVLSLFESKDHLAQAIRWYYNKLQELERKERENRIKAMECGKGIFIPGTWGVRPDQWEQTKRRWEKESQRRQNRRKAQRIRSAARLGFFP